VPNTTTAEPRLCGGDYVVNVEMLSYMAKHDTPSLMMVLSAVDLLLASVVAGIVLFVCLAGASAKNVGKASDKHYSLMLVSITSPVPNSASSGDVLLERVPRLSGISPDVTELSHADSVPAIWFDWRYTRSEPHVMQTYMLDIARDELRFDSLPPMAYIRIDLGITGSIDIFMNCSEAGWSFVWSLSLERFTEDTCKSGSSILFDTDIPILPHKAIITTKFPQIMRKNWTRVGELDDHTLMGTNSIITPLDIYAKGADLMAVIWH
jgi:hypothetical protein